VGIATQDPVLRKKFAGKPEHVVQFFFYVAEEARQLMARLGFRTLNELIGRSDCLGVRRDVERHWKASRLDFSDVLQPAEIRPGVGVCKSQEQDHGLEKALDNELLALCADALDGQGKVRVEMAIKNVHRTVGAMVAGEIARRFGKGGLPQGTIELRFHGSAGQSFGAFMTAGMHLHLAGDANDYVGKGMNGGTLAVRPPKESTFKAEENILIGNTSLYGATGGKAFFNGKAGERFGVRNSGTIAVVEGVGDHGCEYMTGGRVVVIGRTGRNFAAGMSGGYAYVLDADGTFESRCNTGMVELEPLGPEDATFVAELLEEHLTHTQSVQAAHLLAHWEETLPRFVKIVPVDYRRALQEEQARREKSHASNGGHGAGQGESAPASGPAEATGDAAE
jgi:glutamate synthase domain-containing protein 3